MATRHGVCDKYPTSRSLTPSRALSLSFCSACRVSYIYTHIHRTVLDLAVIYFQTFCGQHMSERGDCVALIYSSFLFFDRIENATI